MVIKSATSGPGIKGVALYDSHTDTPIRMAIVEGVTRVPVSLPYGNDLMLDIAAGRVTGTTGVNKFGSGVVAGAFDETIWDGSNMTGVTGYTYMATASTLYISSTDAGDDQVYEIQGLDANWESQIVEATVSGLSFVPLSGTWLRVFRVKNLGATDNAGVIHVSDDNTDTAGGANGIPDDVTNVKAMIAIGNNQTLMAIYTIPTGCTGYMSQWVISAPKGDDVEATLWVRPNGGVFQLKDHHHIYQSKEPREFKPYMKINEKEDIELKGHIGGGGGEVSGGFDLIVETN